MVRLRICVECQQILQSIFQAMNSLWKTFLVLFNEGLHALSGNGVIRRQPNGFQFTDHSLVAIILHETQWLFCNSTFANIIIRYPII